MTVRFPLHHQHCQNTDRSPPNTGPQLDRNIDNAIYRHMLRFQKTSLINITGRRSQRRNKLKDLSCHCIADFMFMLPLYYEFIFMYILRIILLILFLCVLAVSR